MRERLFSIQDVLKESWRLTKENLGFFIGYQIILYLLMWVFGGKSKGNLSFVWDIIGWLILTAAYMGFYNSCLMIVSGMKPGLDQLYQNWRWLITWAVAGLLFAIMFGLGLILLIAPAFYVLARFGLYTFFILDKKLGPVEALQGASRATEGIRFQVFLLFLTCIGLYVLGFLLLGIGILITSPIAMLALAIVYRKITDKKGTVELIVPDIKEKSDFTK